MGDGLKILTVSHGFPPDQMAGAEIYAYKVSMGLQARGMDVTVFAPGSRPEAREYQILTENVDGLPVLRMNNNFLDLHDLASTYANVDIEKVFRQVIAEQSPDIVHVHHTIGTTANNIAIAKKGGAKVIVTLHDFWFHCARGQRLTPRNHLCVKVQPWRCSLCLAKKRTRYLLNYIMASLRGKARCQGDESLLVGLAKLPLRLVPYIFNEFGTRPMSKRRQVMADSLALADIILAPSKFIASKYVEEGVDPQKIKHWPYGLDEGTFPPKEKKTGPTEGQKLRFGFVGTLIPSKGVDLLVAAFQSISPEAATLEIHGGPAGPNGPTYEAKLKQMNRHPGLTFHGRFDNKEIVATLERFDVLVVPSRWYENAPLTLAESSLAGLATITTGHGGMEELAENFGNAITFTPFSKDSLTQAMQRLIDDEGLLCKLKNAIGHVRTVEDDINALLRLMTDLSSKVTDSLVEN